MTDSTAKLRARRASSFGTRAAAYADHRPDYPDAAVAWALEGVRDRKPVRVLDLGAGTGKLSQVLLRHGVELVAVEPDDAMRDELRQRVPGVTALAGSAEDIPLSAGEVDAVLVGQAFHWFNQERALPEIARVLRPEGVLCIVSNHNDTRVPWVAGFGAVADTRSAPATLPEHPAFTPFEQVTFDHAQRRDIDSLIETVATHSHLIVLDERERSVLLDRIRTYLLSCPETSYGEFDLPMVTVSVRATRR